MANGAGRLFNIIKQTGEATNTRPSEIISMTVKSTNPLIFIRDDQLAITAEFCTFNKNLNINDLHIGDIVTAFIFNEGQSYFIMQNNSQNDEKNYNDLENKPKINNIELIGNKSSEDLGLQPEINSSNKLLSDFIDDTNQINKFMTEAEKLELATIRDVKLLPDGDANLQSYWHSLENGWYYYHYQQMTVSNMPENYGLMSVQHLSENDFNIIFYTQAHGNIYRKSGNANTITSWLPIYYESQKTLWEGAMYMNANQTATLSENITAQPNGVVLVWTGYSNSQAQDYEFVEYYVPKRTVSLKGGVGHCIPLFTPAFGNVACKYVYINNKSIVGNNLNGQTGTGTSAIKYTNTHWVLRYVFGV